MTVRMRHTRAHTGNRRSHHALGGSTLTKCSNCGKEKITHRACSACGHYRGRKVTGTDAVAKTEKKQKKAKSAKE